MCYLRVCPFTKAIGQDCTIEKKPDQCCPIITCPEGIFSIHFDMLPIRVHYGCTLELITYACDGVSRRVRGVVEFTAR